MRHLVPALALACERLTRAQGLNSHAHFLRLHGLQMLTEFYIIIEAHGPFLPEAHIARVFNIVDLFLRVQNKLAHIYNDRTKLMHYHITFKSHMFWHLAYQARWWNPRSNWNYSNESYMGKIARIAKSVAFGLGHLKFPVSFADKWRRLQWLRLRRRSPPFLD